MITASAPAPNAAAARSGTRSLCPVVFTQIGIDTVLRTAATIISTRAGSSSVLTVFFLASRA